MVSVAGCMGLVTRSPSLLGGLELARVASSCHIALDMWEEHLKDPTIALDKAVKCLAGLTSGSKRFVKSRVSGNGLQLGGHGNWAKDEGKAFLGRRLALLGPLGQRALAHSVHLLERSREVWAAWRALLLPC